MTAGVDLLIATGNAGKVREFREMLGADRFVWHDLSQMGKHEPVAETGHTFLDNASLKAAGYATQFDMWALADDSGLEVDALAGKPGVHSARWAEMNKAGKGDADNNALLLGQLGEIPDGFRGGRFVCVLTLSAPSGKIILTARDTIEGQILRSPRGVNGFGYDPLFMVEALGKTIAELTGEQKHQISHRGKALRRLRQLMDQTL